MKGSFSGPILVLIYRSGAVELFLTLWRWYRVIIDLGACVKLAVKVKVIGDSGSDEVLTA